MNLLHEEQEAKDIRRFREVFKGRFDHNTATKLISELGGVDQAFDFVMTEDRAVVGQFLNKDEDYLESIRKDSEKLANILEHHIEHSLRQFVCGDCKRSWWRRVPIRKEVSRCKRCHVRLDPLPREHEFGIGKFLCPCGHEFTGFACMGETLSECYQCGDQVPVNEMIQPRKNRTPKTNCTHSCNGVNCYHADHNHDASQAGTLTLSLDPYKSAGAMIGGGGGRGKFKPKTSSGFISYEPGVVPVCVHPKSGKTAIRHASKKHVSTGSTVSTFISQRSLDTQSVSVIFSLYSIDE